MSCRRAQRIISSLESIRFNVLALDIGEQNFVITGNEGDLGRYRSGGVEIEGELVYLADTYYSKTFSNTDCGPRANLFNYG